MRRKLVNYDVFQRMVEDSLSKAEEELVLAEDVLSKALDCECLNLVSFGESDVIYETCNGNYVHATYRLVEGKLLFENIEEMVVEEESEKANAKEILRSMVDSLLEDNDALAADKFNKYLAMPIVRRNLKHFNENTNESVSRVARRPVASKRIQEVKKTKKNRSKQNELLENRRNRTRNKVSNSRGRVYARKAKPSKVNEWATLCENVYGWVDYKEFGPVLKESVTQRDNRGNVTGLAMPTAQKRNEGKILSFNWKTLDHEVKVLRSNAKTLHEDVNFCRAVADLKRYNNISDNSGLEEVLENIVAKWPNVLYLTQQELSECIHSALDTAGVNNFDDNTCDFMAEGILRTAHQNYTDRVKKITTMAGVNPEVTTENSDENDSYSSFQNVINEFYPSLDINDEYELQVFGDLYSALHEIYRMANNEGDELTMSEISSYMNSCEAVLNRHEQPDAELAEEIATWLKMVVETNLGGGEWNVSNTTHNTINGDHPAMAEKARKGYTPSSDFEPEWGDPAPVSDGKSYHGNLADEMRNRGFGNVGGDGVYPSLKNPYVPQPFGDYTMKGEKGADRDGENDHSRWQSSDTWPNLQNPYVPQEKVGTGGKGYKMKSDNLVVDK